MTTTTTTISVLLPCHHQNLIPPQRSQDDSDDDGDGDEDSLIILLLLPVDYYSSRLVWREIWPCIFQQQSPPLQEQVVVACHMMRSIYHNVSRLRNQNKRAVKICCRSRRSRKCKNKNHPKGCPNANASLSASGAEQDENDPTVKEDTALFYHCDLPLRWKEHNRRNRNISTRQRQYTLLIVPSMETKIEYSWEERLIHLERDLIQKQSIAGLYSTLGGGYFMTRRLSTANALAREQQRIAAILGNKEMYYKCTINQAYNEIYAGRFRQARQHILQVWMALAREKHLDEKSVLQNMCKSAMWFRKRVRDARLHHDEQQPDGVGRLVDDFSRIRVVKDQSTRHDLQMAPLARVKV